MGRVIQFGKPIIGEEEKRAVAEVLNGDILVHGPKAKEFEAAFADFTGAPYVVSTSSCTASLHLTYFYLGIGPDDEVIVPAQTHAATAHAVEYCGGRPVFVDSEPETGNIDIDRIELALTPRTKAISLVHYLGMPVDMERIAEIAEKYSLFVVEDCALAIGTRFKGVHAGLLGDVGCFSFYPVKHMTTAEGGMLTTWHESVAVKIARQKAFGVDRTVSERSEPGIYDVTMLGFNYRMNELEAALGIEQLKRIEGVLALRQANYEILTQGLEQIDEISLFRSSHDHFQSSYYCHSAVLNSRLSKKRSEIVKRLKAFGVGTSVYYPKPVPHFTYYRDKYGYADDSFPVAAKISGSSIALPVGAHLTVEDMEYIVEMLKKTIFEVKHA